jgi:hypothetical protein
MQCSPEIRRLAGNPGFEVLLDRLGLPRWRTTQVLRKIIL